MENKTERRGIATGIVLILVVVAFGVGLGAGVLGLLWATGGNAEPSQDTSNVVPTLSLDDPTDMPVDDAATQIAALADKVDALSTQVADPAANATQIAAVGQLSEQVGAFGTQLSGLDTDVRMLSTQIAGISNNVDSISANISGLLQMEELRGSATPVIRLITSTPLPTSVPTLTFTPTPPEPVTTEEPAAPVTTEEPEAAAVAATPTPLAVDSAAGVSGRALFAIYEEESEARFRINEVLAGSPFEVVGVSKRVGGQIIVNFDNPSLSTIGDIAVNARVFKTDNEFRDQSIRGRILQSSQDDFEFIFLRNITIQNISTDPVSVGDTLTFQITGDLTIRGTTRTETFDTTVTVAAADRIEGYASVEILYADYGLTIQAPPQVAGIEENVILEIDFVALPVEQ